MEMIVPSFKIVMITIVNTGRAKVLGILSQSSWPEQLKSLLAKKLFEDPGHNHQKLKIYLEEFVNRRKVHFDFLPNEFKKWLT